MPPRTLSPASSGSHGPSNATAVAATRSRSARRRRSPSSAGRKVRVADQHLGRVRGHRSHRTRGGRATAPIASPGRGQSEPGHRRSERRRARWGARRRARMTSRMSTARAPLVRLASSRPLPGGRLAERARTVRAPPPPPGPGGCATALVERFLPLARHVARRYDRGRASRYEDVFQVACLGPRQGGRPLRPRPRRSPSRATRCRRWSARSSATSATRPGPSTCTRELAGARAQAWRDPSADVARAARPLSRRSPEIADRGRVQRRPRRSTRSGPRARVPRGVARRAARARRGRDRRRAVARPSATTTIALRDASSSAPTCRRSSTA